MTDDDVPLKALQEPGNFRCQWFIPRDADDGGGFYQPGGEVDLLASRQPYGSVLGNVPIRSSPAQGGGISQGFPQHYNYSTLRGELTGGGSILLLDAHLTVMGSLGMGFNFPSGNAHIDSAVALVGRYVPNDASSMVDTIRVQITGLDKIAADSPILDRTVPIQCNQETPMTWSVTTNPDSNPTWSDAGSSLSIEHSFAATVFDRYRFSLRFAPVVRISLTKPVGFMEAYEAWVQPLYKVICALTGKEEGITYLAVSPVIEGLDESPGRRLCQVFASSISQEPYMPQKEKGSRKVSPALTVGQGGVSLLELVRGWRQLEHEGNPLIHTYDPYALQPAQHPRARFLFINPGPRRLIWL